MSTDWQWLADASNVRPDALYKMAEDLWAEPQQLRAEALEMAARIGTMQAEIERLQAEIERLRTALDRDKTGLAGALAEILTLCRGYDWATVGRGPYEWDDDRYRAEFGQALRSIGGVARKALTASGTLANEALAHSQEQPARE
jgi:uncharacterized small protein (DUF1192 family)